MNSRVAFVSDSPLPSGGTLPNYPTAPEIPFATYSYQPQSPNQVQIQIQVQNPSQSSTQSPVQNSNPSQIPNPSPIQSQNPIPSQIQNPIPIANPIASQSQTQTQSALQSQSSFTAQAQSPSQTPSQSQSQLLSQSKAKSKSQTHRHNLTELDFETILPYRATRTMSLDYRDTVYSSKKKDSTVDSSLLLKTPAEKKNSSVYDVDSNGKLEPIALFSQTFTNVIMVNIASLTHG